MPMSTTAVPFASSTLVERLNETVRWQVDATPVLRHISEYQAIEVFDTPQFGRLYCLDGRIMAAETDEFICHESVVHSAALAHALPVSALIVGGGDGGTARQLLRHGTIKQVVLVEQDVAVIEIAKTHFPSMHANAFSDPRLHLVIADAYGWIKAASQRFDLMILDLTDSDTQASVFYQPEFFTLARQVLNPGGALSLSLGSPVFQPRAVRACLQALKSRFSIVRVATMYIPSYGTLWSIAVASDEVDPLTVASTMLASRLDAQGIDALQYYSPAMHTAMFTLPPCWQPILS